MDNLTPRQEMLARWKTGSTSATGFVTAPASGATITIWDSGANEANANVTASAKGHRWKRLIWNGIASHDSGANGLSFEQSFDDGTNWDVLVQYTNLASTVYQRFVAVSGPRVRVRYTNSASTLTIWRGCLIGDEYERGTQ